MPTLAESYPELVAALADRYGRADPGPAGDASFPALLAAALADSLEPRKAEALLDRLRDEGLLDPDALAAADPAEVAELARQQGVKLLPKALGPVLRLAAWYAVRGGAEGLERAATDDLRESLRALNGIGPARADALLLFGLGRPAYPLDRATYRILARHGWIDPTAEAEEARSAVERCVDGHSAELRRLSAWMERLGKEYCRATVARCEQCPLRPWLPPGGPISPDG